MTQVQTLRLAQEFNCVTNEIVEQYTVKEYTNHTVQNDVLKFKYKPIGTFAPIVTRLQHSEGLST